jgi:DNA-directed RNA polymerase beta' subunit
LKVEIVNINDEFAGLQEVTSPRIFYRNRFDPHGLFSEQIFGCVEDYRCQCGRYYGKEYLGVVVELWCHITISE